MIRGVVRLCLTAALFGFASVVAAYGTVPGAVGGTCFKWRLGFNGYMGNTYDSPSGVVADCEAYRQADYSCVLAGQQSADLWSIEVFNAQGERVGFDEARRFETTEGCQTCPAQSTRIGTACVCDLGFKPNQLSGQCVAVDCPGELGFLGSSAVGGAGLSVCYAGCSFTGAVGVQSGSGANIVYGPFRWAPGAYCNGQTGGTPPVPTGSDTSGPSPCPRPLVPGQVNGQTVCVPAGSATTTGPSTSTTTPSGAASAPPGSQSGTSSSSTTCANGSCNTTVTNYGPGGGGGGPGPVVGETTTTESEESYCTRNPTSPICDEQDEGSWGGSCEGGFSCDGDAVQCAMARDQHARNCRDLTPNAYTAIGETVLGSAANTTVGGGLIGIASSDINVGTGIIGSAVNPFGAACPADVPLVLGETTVVIPLASTCSALQTMGGLLIAITALWCAAWLVKGR